MECNTIRHH